MTCRSMGSGTDTPRRLRRDRQGEPPSMTQSGSTERSRARLTPNPQAPPTGRLARALDGAASIRPLTENIHDYPLSQSAPPGRQVVDCAELVNNAAFLDQYGSRTPLLRNVNLRTPPRMKRSPMRKCFGLPEKMVPVCVNGEDWRVVRTLTNEPLQVRIDQATPWVENMTNPGPFPRGSVQRAVAESAAERYADPRLADIGGFFFHAVPKRRSVCNL